MVVVVVGVRPSGDGGKIACKEVTGKSLSDLVFTTLVLTHNHHALLHLSEEAAHLEVVVSHLFFSGFVRVGVPLLEAVGACAQHCRSSQSAHAENQFIYR